MNYFPDEVIEHIFDFIASHKDRNSISLVSKSWHKIERCSRKRVFIGNCYAINPERLIQRFPSLRSLTLKGKPHFADFNLVPHEWGGFVHPWIVALAKARVGLEELRLKRMVVSDESLELLSRSFSSFKSLVLVSCEGFTTDGLASVAANCRHLRELDLQENEIDDHRGQWLNCFPESSTALTSLNFSCLKGETNLAALERLVARSPNLESLKVNRAVPLDALTRLMSCAPQLVDLGVGSYENEPDQESFMKLMAAIKKCTELRSLSGFSEVAPLCLTAFYPICQNLTSLNLSYAAEIQGNHLISYFELQELRVFPSDLHDEEDNDTAVTEIGLVAISAGCPKLHSILYFCKQMTNAALITVAKNCPNFIRFRLCILEPNKPDHTTSQSLDEGFGAIVQACKGLRRLSVSGLLTDKVFLYIGMYAEQLEMLSIAFAGDTDKGMLYVLNGCKKMRKLEIRDSPFGNAALLADVDKYRTMRSLWMSSCEVTLGGCKRLARNAPWLNVEIINENENNDVMERNEEDEREKVDRLYLYRTVVGARKDAPPCVTIL
ncbi:hypothetical protein IGI04_038707 [Brassica rapa subsp. trilocularis]|uniref:F-box domain-containing protein n=1 Tax=Brassica rapa subsp. trilocularis TaxID=1813537 RepID=A0ABQ7LLV5_BRACM|nr:hypothetical protein IGI04_038707 [Brassica rapa subsp. trilocularis]